MVWEVGDLGGVNIRGLNNCNRARDTLRGMKGALIIGIGFLGTVLIIRNPQNSFGTSLARIYKFARLATREELDSIRQVAGTRHVSQTERA